MERAASAFLRVTAIWCYLAIAACASIRATDTQVTGPVQTVTLTATGVDNFFSRFTGSPDVKSASVQLATGATGPATTTAIIPIGSTVSYAFQPAIPPFHNGDILTVVWKGNTTSGTVEKTTTHRFVNPVLKVQTPWYGLNPGETGSVCIEFTDAANIPVQVVLSTPVQLTSTVFPGGVSPTTLTVAAGQSKPANRANITASNFACPKPSGGAILGGILPPRPPCDASRGVVATAVYDGQLLSACAEAGETCCGVGTTHCTGPAAPASICP